MEALLKNEESSSKPSDVLNFKRLLMPGCKVSYISNARVTEADADDWMALPLLKEKETEATFSQRHFLLLHVPSLREFLHKFDVLPPPTEKPPTEFLRSIKLEEPEKEFPRTFDPLPAPSFTAQEPLFEVMRSIKLEEPEKETFDPLPAPSFAAHCSAQEPLFEVMRSIKLEELEKDPIFECQRSIKLEDPDIDTNSVLETSVMTTSSLNNVFIPTSGCDDVIDQKPMRTIKREMTSPDSSYFELDDVPSEERGPESIIDRGPAESSLDQNDLSQLSDFFITNFSEANSALAPTPQTPSFSFSSSPPATCSFRIEPAPAVDCEMAGADSLDDPAVALMNLIAAAAAAAPPPPAGGKPLLQPSLFEPVADLPPVRKVNAVAVKKQATVQSPCPRCYVMIEKLDEARAHIEDATCVTIGSHACDVCAKRLASKWTLKKHVERHSEKPRCVFCSNRFDSMEQLRDHNLLSGHMFRPEEAGAGALEISQLRKVRRKEQKEAMRSKEASDNLALMIEALEGGVSAAAAASEKGQPAAKKRKTTGQLEDEAAAAVAFLMEEDAVGGED